MRVLRLRMPETCCFKPKCKASHIYKNETSLNTIPKYQNTKNWREKKLPTTAKKNAKNCQKEPKTKIGLGGLWVYSF